MNIEYHKTWSENLQQDMEFKVYGHAGKPVLVFPAHAGRFFEFEDFGMLEAVSGQIESGAFQFYTADSVDAQSWSNWDIAPAERALRHQAYDRYITQELVPIIRQRCGKEAMCAATGVSMGGYHSGNFFFRHPDLFDAVISLSGVFQLKMFVGDYMDENVFVNSPLDYLPGLNDPWYLDRYRKSHIVLCVGQGAWEEEMLSDIKRMKAILEEKNVPAWIDFWGQDVNHDWPWWRKMLPYHLDRFAQGDAGVPKVKAARAKK